MNKYNLKEMAKRAFRTFLQTACGYIVTNVSLVCAGIDFTDGNAVLNVLTGLAISAVSAGVAAIMNLEKTESEG